MELLRNRNVLNLKLEMEMQLVRYGSNKSVETSFILVIISKRISR